MSDGFGADVPYIPPATRPGVFEPIAQVDVTPVSDPPSATPTPVDKMLATVRPFTYDTPSDYRPDPPYALTSKKLRCVTSRNSRLVGRLEQHRSDGCTDARPFAPHPATRRSSSTAAPCGRLLRTSARSASSESARLLGYAWVANGRHDDRLLGRQVARTCSGGRITRSNEPRPTESGDPGAEHTDWLPPLVTGNHPEYPSGHSCFTASIAEVLHRYFGTKEVGFTVSSTTLHNGPADA